MFLVVVDINGVIDKKECQSEKEITQFIDEWRERARKNYPNRTFTAQVYDFQTSYCLEV